MVDSRCEQPISASRIRWVWSMGPTYFPLVVWVYGINRGYHGDCVLADVLRGGGFAREDDGYEYNGCFVRWMKSLYA